MLLQRIVQGDEELWRKPSLQILSVALSFWAWVLQARIWSLMTETIVQNLRQSGPSARIKKRCTDFQPVMTDSSRQFAG